MVWRILFCSLCSCAVGLERGDRDSEDVVGEGKSHVGLRRNRGIGSGRNIGGNIKSFKPVTTGITR